MDEYNQILLIDDEPDILRVLSLSLKADGYKVHTAASGEEGLTVFRQQSPDIVITDIKMPGMDGLQVLRAIKEINAETEVIIITGHGDIDSAIEALQYGASDFINKPVRDAALNIALQRAKERLSIRQQLKDYTVDLEQRVEIATRELRRQANFQAKLIRSSNDGIVATDRDLRIVIYNPGAEGIFGYPAEKVINRMRLDALLPSELSSPLQEAMEGRLAQKEFPWQEVRIFSESGEQIPVRYSDTILQENGRNMGSVAFFQDLREIKRLERELIKSERLAAIGQTVAGLAHGLKNILHGLKGGRYLVDLGIKKDDTDKLTRGWDMVRRNIDRTSELVMDLLSYSKEREPEPEDCDPNEIAAEVCDLLEERARENGVAIDRELDPAIGRVFMDPRTVHTSLLNLMTNALDACLFDEDTSKQWRVKVKTARESDDAIRFEVTDNGSGMTPEVRDKLFSSFFSTKGHRGTGLGLMVTRKLLEEHGGSISVDSSPGKGTTFTIRMPYQASEES